MKSIRKDNARPTRLHWMIAFVLVLLSLALTLNSVTDSVRLGLRDEETQYVLVAPILVGWLVWVRRHRLVYCQLGGNWIGVMMMLLGWAATSVGFWINAPMLWHGGPLLLASGALVSVIGVDLLRIFFPAFLALMFVVPITPRRRQIIAAPMEKYAAVCTQWSCELLGLHVNRYGNLLSVNGTDVQVAEACNGMRQVITFWLVCFLICFSAPWRWQTRLVILLVVPLVAVFSNVVRLVPTVWMYSRGAGEAADRFHDIFGWVMLGVAFAALYGLLAVVRWIGVPVRRLELACQVSI